MRVSIGDRGILPATKTITWWVLDQNPLCNEVACYCTKFSNYINYYYIVTFKEYPCFPSDQWLLVTDWTCGLCDWGINVKCQVGQRGKILRSTSGHKLSQAKKCITRGVPQGSILVPFLLPLRVNGCRFCLFLYANYLAFLFQGDCG